MVSQQFIYDETEAITQGIEAAAGIASILQSFQTVQIAQNYYNLYAAQRNYYFNTFQNGVESPLIGMLATDIPYTENYPARIATAWNPNTGVFGGNASDATGWWKRHSAMYGTTPDPYITEAAVDIPRVQSDWSNYLFRFEEYWYDIRNDQRWYKRMAVHNIGIKQGSAIVPALHYGLTNLTNQIGDMADQLATYGNGAAKYAGYKRGLSDVDDFFRRGTSFKAPDTTGMNTASSAGWQGIPYMQPGQR
jgi:hypothetical protein